MPAPKIVLYFTPDIQEIGRIPISSIKFDTSKFPERGRYEISISEPCFIDGNSSNLKSAIKSDAVLNFKSVCFGEQSKYIFKVNDYFEIWDTRDSDDEWCYFRGVVKQPSSMQTGDKRTFSLSLENAGGWALGDNSIYYLGQLIITQGGNPSKLFNPIKSKYGWIDASGKLTDKGEKIAFNKIKKPPELMETLVDLYANERIKILKDEFYEHESIKSIGFKTGVEISKETVFIANRLSKMEGSILQILTQFEGRPFNEIFITESTVQTNVIWRNSRWRDFNEKLCMGGLAGDQENLIILNTGERSITDDYKNLGYKKVIEYSKMITENINKTNADVINAIFIFPPSLSANTSVPTVVLAQTAFDPEGSKNLLDLNSIIRHGYRPIKINLPFIPRYLEGLVFSETESGERKLSNDAANNIRGKYLSEHTDIAASMYRNIQNSGNGASAFQNNLHCTVADDFKITRSIQEEDFFVNVHKITWYFDPEEPRTVLEWDRGFEQVRQEGKRDTSQTGAG